MDADSDLRLVKQGNYRKLVSGCNGVTVNRGVVTNVPSNLKVANQLPVGTNKNIGSLEDLANSSILYYNYNDTGKHGIYRWFRNKQGFLNGLIEKIYEVRDPSVYTPFNENPLDFSPNAEHRITGSYLIDNFLFFTDKHSRSKFIDVIRANESNKKRKFNVYFNRNTFGQAQTYTLNIWDGATGNNIGTLSWSSSASTYEQQTTDFINAYRATSLGNIATIEDLNKFSTLTMNSVGEFYIELLSTITPLPSIVPENFYPDKNPLVPSYQPFSRDLIDRLCYVPLCDPTVTYETDTTISTNFVNNRVFQARARYQYFDNSWSVYSAISTIPIQKHACSPNNFGSADNYVLIDFTDPRLEDSGLASIVKKVEIAILQPVLSEQWTTVAALDPYQFVGVGQQKYNFYNTETSIAIPVSDTVKPYDSLFIRHKSDEFVDDRGFPADGIEGYSKIPLDAQVRIQYEEPQNTSVPTFTISGKLRIYNYWQGTGSAITQPIYKLAGGNGDTYWGGGFAGATVPPFTTTGFLQIQGSPSAHNQIIPLQGFTIYLAGTPYFAITKQRVVFPPPSTTGITQDPTTGVLTIPTSGNLQYAAYLQALDNSTTEHEFTITGVPAGKYVLRVAGHQITTADLNINTLSFQKTSTNTVLVDTSFVTSPNTGGYEIEVDVTGNVTGICIAVADLGDTDTVSIKGYLCDNDVTPPLTGAAILGDTRINRAIITWNSALPYAPVIHAGGSWAGGVVLAVWTLSRSVTDHNGYYWYAVIDPTASHLPANISFNTIQIGNYVSVAPTIILSNGGAYGGTIPDNTGVDTISQNVDINVTNYAKTYIEGTVIDSTDGTVLSGVSLVLGSDAVGMGYVPIGTNFRVGFNFSFTDFSGIFRIPMYAVATTQYGKGNLFINTTSNGLCLYAVDQSLNPISISITIDNHGTNSTWFDKANTDNLGALNNIVSILSFFISQSKWKRGSDRFMGIAYADEGDRKTAVCLIDDNVHITFYSERDKNGVLQPTGAANLLVDINNEPPDWATKYFIVAMKNQQEEDHLVWLANKVDYLDGAGNVVSYGSGSAVKAQINLDNIGYYTTDQYPNATVAYTFQAGDRIRFIQNDAGSYYTTYYDYEILSATATDIFIPVDNTVEFKSGCSFELYTPKTTDQTKVFYEIGHCGHIESAIINGQLKKYHTGNIQNQTYAALGQDGDLNTNSWTLGAGWSYAAGVLTSNGTNSSSTEPVNILPNTRYRIIVKIITGQNIFLSLGSSTVASGLSANPEPYTLDVTSGTLSTLFGIGNLGGVAATIEIQSITLSTPSITQLEWGDVYYRARNIAFNVPTVPPSFRTINVTDDSISDFYPSRAIGWGRPNTDADSIGQIDRVSTIRFSNRYISGTLINGLRNFEALNEKQFSTSYGELLKLQLVDKTVLKAIFSNSFMVSMYINQGVLRTANGSTLVSISTDVIAQTHEMQRNFGSLNSESIVLNDEADLFGWDENVGVVWRSSGNGLLAVSEQLMITAFNDIQKKRVDLGRNNSEVVAVYDNNTDMLIMSFRPITPKPERKSKVIVSLPDFYSNLGAVLINVAVQPLNLQFGSLAANLDPDYPDITKIINKLVNANLQGWTATTDAYGNSVIESPDGSSTYYNQSLVVNVNGRDYSFVFENGSPQGTGTPYAGETLAYCKGKNGWTEYYPFVPEGYGRLRQDYVSFLNGEMWLHGDTSQYNNFYGVQYSRTLTVPFNLGFEKVKTYKYIEVNTDEPCYCPNISIPSNDQNQVGMLTEITAPAFKVVLGKYWAKIPKDKLTPWMQPNQQQAWVNGRSLRGQVLVAEISTDSTNLAALIETKVDSFFEERS